MERNKNAIKSEPSLIAARHAIGLYSIDEIRDIFSKDGKRMGRHHIDNAMNCGDLMYMCPNGRDRYVRLDDFLNYMQEQTKEKAATTLEQSQTARRSV